MSSPATEPLPDDVETLKALILMQREALTAAQARAASAENEARVRALEIEKLKLAIAKLRHERFGQSSERGALLDQLELQLFELEEDGAQAETAKDMAKPSDPQTVAVQSFARRKPARRPLPEHLPRERVVHPAPSSCPCSSVAFELMR